jgi:hypothetical protein
MEEITQEEIEFMEGFSYPIQLAECLISNADNLALFNEEDFLKLRLAQYPLLSYEYLLDLDSQNLSESEKMALREGAGNIYCFGGRNFGKSLVVEKFDLIEYFLHGENEDCGFTSFDLMHIKGIIEAFLKAVEYHPIVIFFKKTVNRGTNYRITNRNGMTIESVNMNICDGTKAGNQFLQKHFKKLYSEEASKETKKVYEARVESVHETGCVERFAGMTNFTKSSPAGKMFFDNENPTQVVNLPAYVNPTYDKKREDIAVKKYNGKQSIGFRIFIDGEVIQEGVSALDMERIRRLCYPRKSDGSLDEDVIIKNIEIDKKNFGMYRALCIVDKPQHIDRLVIASDVGEIGGTSEIIIMAEISNKWRYLYNITVRNLPEKDTYLIFKYLYQRLNPNYIALDCTGGSPGRGVYGYLESDTEIDKSRLIWVDFGEKIEVGIETDNEGKPIRDNNKIVKKFENTTIWSVERLCHLLYTPLVFLPLDYKLDEQLDAVIAIVRGNNISYECATDENHLFQAFQVFAIAHWTVEYSAFTKVENTLRKKHCNSGA